MAYVVGKVDQILTELLNSENPRVPSRQISEIVNLSEEVVIDYVNHIKSISPNYVFIEPMDYHFLGLSDNFNTSTHSIWIPQSSRSDVAWFLSNKGGGYGGYVDDKVRGKREHDEIERRHKHLIEDNLIATTAQAKDALKNSKFAKLLSIVALIVSIVAALASAWQAYKTK